MKTLEAAEQSVESHRQLAADDLALYKPDLARALANLSMSLNGVSGNTLEALKFAKESLDYYKSLVLHYPQFKAYLAEMQQRIRKLTELNN